MIPQQGPSTGKHLQIQSLIDRKKWDDAEREIDHLLDKNSSDADAFYLRGVMYYFRGSIRGTLENLRKCMDLDPHHTDAAICLSVLYNDIGRYEDAKGVFEKANRSVEKKGTGEDPTIDKKFSIKHLELADLYFRYRRYTEAVDEYSKAILLDPRNLEIRIRRAKAYSKKGFVSRAIQELHQIKDEDPSYVQARLQLGLLHYSQKNVLEAELEWEQVLKIDPGNIEAASYLDMAKENRI